MCDLLILLSEISWLGAFVAEKELPLRHENTKNHKIHISKI